MNATHEPIAVTHYSPKQDVLIVSLPFPLEGPEDAEVLRETMRRECGPDVRVLLLNPGVSIAILRRDEESV